MKPRRKSPEERNQELVDRLDRFQVLIQRRHPWLSARVRALLPEFWETRLPLDRLTERDLTRISGVGPKVAAYLHRLFQGEGVEALAAGIAAQGAKSDRHF